METPSQRSESVRMSDGAVLFVKLLGFDDSRKPVIIAHHGAPGAADHHEAEEEYAFLANRFRVLVFDSRGSGASIDQKGPYTRARFVSDVEELRRWIGTEKFIIAGASFGGVVALSYAVTHQDKLLAMIVRSTFAESSQLNRIYDTIISSGLQNVDKDLQMRLWIDGTIQSNEEYAHAMMQILPLMPYDASKHHVAADAVTHTPVFNYRVFSELVGTDMKSYNVVDKLGKIGCPALVATGLHDKMAPPSCAEVTHRAIPGSKLAVFENSGHSPPGEEPEEWKACVTEFLNGLCLSN